MTLEPLEPRRAPAVADTDALVALAHRARSGNECTCATGRGTIVNFDLREPNDARAFVVRGARRREVNALTWRNEHALFHASDAVVVELDARKMSAAGDAAVIRRFEGAGDVVNGVDVDQDDAMLAACDDAGEVIAYDLSNGEILRKLRGHDGCVTTVAFRRKRGASECATASTDCRAMKWDVKAKSVPVRTWDARNMLSAEDYDCGKITARAEDESASIDAGASAKAFNPPMLHSLAFYRGETSEENAPGLRRVAVSACGDGSVIVFDIDHPGVSGGSRASKGKKKSSLASAGPFADGRVECVRLGADGVRGHTNAATCADFVPWNRTGDVIVSGGADRRLLVWNWVDEASHAARGLPVASIERDRKINDLAFAADSRAICVADTSPTLKLFALR